MESNCWINSVEEEEEETEQESVDLGVGRLYECVFCKRGFNTAQALGGHMNIHRKDRVKNKPNSSKQEQEQHLISPPGMYQYHHINIPPPDQIFAYFPVPTTVPGIGAVYGNYQHHHHHQFLSVDSDHDHRQIKPLDDPVVPVGDNWSLSLRFVEDLEREKNQEEELDLELRLGYDS